MGVVNQVEDARERRECRQVHRGGPVAGVHPHGRGVHQDIRVGVAGEVVVAVLAVAGDHDDFARAFPADFRLYAQGRAAAPQNHDLLSAKGDSRQARHVPEPECVRIPRAEFAVDAARKRVDAPDFGGVLVHPVAVGQDGLFIGHGDIQAADVLTRQKFRKRFRLQLDKAVSRTAQRVVNRQ